MNRSLDGLKFRSDLKEYELILVKLASSHVLAL